MAIQANFGFINVRNGGGIKRLVFFSLVRGSNKELLECLENQECVCVCVSTHVFRQCEMLSFGV